MVKGKAVLAKGLVTECAGTFEKKRKNYIDAYDTYGTMVKRKLYATDKEERYFHIYHSVQKESAERTAQFQFYEERIGVIEEELSYCGYYVIVTSEQMRASEALELYKGRDASEKLFRGDKSYLGDKSMRTYGWESTDNKIFVEFVALIIRNRIYNCLKDKMLSMDKRPNYMTAAQKDILDAFGLDAQNIKYRAAEIGKELCG
jgi:hypothetical protein